MNKLSTKLEFPKFKEIFKNYKKESFWKKEWLIFENKSVNMDIKIRLVAIFPTENKIVLSKYNYYLGWSDNNIEIPLREDFTELMFRKKLYRFIFGLIREYENNMISIQDDVCKMSREADNNYRKIINEFINQKEHTNYTLEDWYDLDFQIRNSYTTIYRRKHHKEYENIYKEYNKLKDSYKFKLFEHVYKHFLSNIEEEDIRKEYEKEIAEKIEELRGENNETNTN